MSSGQLLPDLLKLISENKTKYTVHCKSSGQLLGYAFLLPEVQLPDQVHLAPWLEDFQQPAEAAPDTDLSQDLSVNETVSSQCINNLENELLLTSHDELNRSVVLSQASTSTNLPVLSPSSPTVVQHVTKTSSVKPLAAGESSQVIPLQMFAEQGATTEVNTATSHNDKDFNAQSAYKQKDYDCSDGKRKFVDKVDINSNKKGKVEYKDQFQTGVEGRYDAFIDVVAPGVNREKSKVRCLLCTDGKIYFHNSIGRHIKAVHEPPVNCENCGREFNVVQIRHHKKKCVRQNLKLVERNKNDPSCDFKADQVKPKQVVLPTSKHVPVHCNPLNAINSRSFCAAETNSVSSGKTKDKFSSQPTSVTSLVSPQSSVQPSRSLEGYTSLTMTSATVQGVSLKVAVKKEARTRKAMKKFGKRYRTDLRTLKFLLGSSELTGNELVADLEGSIIYVHGELAR
eukprot:GFUD01036458.1.p1 GENE.GFUD01036458.1~~GFUD01036458.1.p1  ORF type:complete len:455 (+),score=107.54 GFUD01036458.1:43-1407(+)